MIVYGEFTLGGHCRRPGYRDGDALTQPEPYTNVFEKVFQLIAERKSKLPAAEEWFAPIKEPVNRGKGKVTAPASKPCAQPAAPEETNRVRYKHIVTADAVDEVDEELSVLLKDDFAEVGAAPAPIVAGQDSDVEQEEEISGRADAEVTSAA
jgi:hypothetical protein